MLSSGEKGVEKMSSTIFSKRSWRITSISRTCEQREWKQIATTEAFRDVSTLQMRPGEKMKEETPETSLKKEEVVEKEEGWNGKAEEGEREKTTLEN